MKIYHNEFDPKCCEVLERHFPDSVVDRRSIEDVKAEEVSQYPQCHFFAGIGGFSEAFRRAGVGADRNVWTGGFPCQDLSVAGKRAGLAGSRSGLYFHFQRLVAQARPDIVLAENVPGLLSSNGGRDFAIVLGGFTGIIPAVPDRGWGSAGFLRGRIYSVAYRIFDAQYFGVAQRRRRVFIVASLATRERPLGKKKIQDDKSISGLAAEILFEPKSVFRDPPSRGEAGKESTAYAIRRAQTSSNGRGIDDAVAHALDETGGDAVARPLAGHHTRRDLDNETYVAFGGGNTSGPIDVATARNVKGDTRLDFDTETFVTFSPRAASGRSMTIDNEIVQPLEAANNAAHAVAFTERTRADGRNFEMQEELAYALTNPGSGGRTHSRQIAETFGLRRGVRRLVPVECERLQGFEDDWTDDQSDSARYRQLGNAMAITNVEWIARRIRRLYQRQVIL